MARMTRDNAAVASMGDGLLLIHYDQFWDDGENMGGDLIFEAGAAGWLAERIEAAADPCGAPDVDQRMQPDHFVVLSRGGEHGEEVNVHVHNRRDPSVLLGGTYALGGMSPATARDIAAQLHAISPR
jgi:hypothetical protein